jgi:hypothetical protein
VCSLRILASNEGSRGAILPKKHPGSLGSANPGHCGGGEAWGSGRLRVTSNGPVNFAEVTIAAMQPQIV